MLRAYFTFQFSFIHEKLKHKIALGFIGRERTHHHKQKVVLRAAVHSADVAWLSVLSMCVVPWMSPIEGVAVVLWWCKAVLLQCHVLCLCHAERK
jgi:hypothetical protein